MTRLDSRIHAENFSFTNYNKKNTKGHKTNRGERLKALTKECQWALHTWCSVMGVNVAHSGTYDLLGFLVKV